MISGERPDLSCIMSGCPADIVALLYASWDPDISKRFSMELISQSMGRILSEAGSIPPLDFYS